MSRTVLHGAATTPGWLWCLIGGDCPSYFRAPAFDCGGRINPRGGNRHRHLEEGMKSRLRSTIWTLVLVNGLVLFGVLWLADSARRQSNGACKLHFGSLPRGPHRSWLFVLI